jgi:hypothetical protein
MKVLADDYRTHTYHVVPLNDLREHNTASGKPCWCEPRVDYENGFEVHIHNSLDQREKFETGVRKPS